MLPITTRAFLLFPALAALASTAHAYDNGAGTGVCVSGTPGGGATSTSSHGTFASGAGAYSLSFSPALPASGKYAPDTEYTLTLGGASFGGFAITPLGAGSGSAIAAGTGAKAMGGGCDSGPLGITHTNAFTAKNSVTGTWTSPTSGQAQIRWTVKASTSKSAGNFYIQTVTLDSNATSAATPAATPAPAPADGSSASSSLLSPSILFILLASYFGLH